MHIILFILFFFLRDFILKKKYIKQNEFSRSMERL